MIVNWFIDKNLFVVGLGNIYFQHNACTKKVPSDKADYKLKWLEIQTNAWNIELYEVREENIPVFSSRWRKEEMETRKHFTIPSFSILYSKNFLQIFENNKRKYILLRVSPVIWCKVGVDFISSDSITEYRNMNINCNRILTFCVKYLHIISFYYYEAENLLI